MSTQGEGISGSVLGALCALAYQLDSRACVRAPTCVLACPLPASSLRCGSWLLAGQRS